LVHHQCFRDREGRQNLLISKNGPPPSTSKITHGRKVRVNSYSHFLFSDITRREALRSVLLLQHEKFIQLLYGNSPTQTQPDGTCFGHPHHIIPPRSLRSTFNFSYSHAHKLTPCHRVYQRSGIWWREQKLKSGSSIKFFHPAPIHEGKFILLYFLISSPRKPWFVHEDWGGLWHSRLLFGCFIWPVSANSISLDLILLLDYFLIIPPITTPVW